MKIDLNKLKYTFRSKPLLVGGLAMEYYGLRKAGDDIDFIVSGEDYEGLAKLYSENKKDLFGDLNEKIQLVYKEQSNSMGSSLADKKKDDQNKKKWSSL